MTDVTLKVLMRRDIGFTIGCLPVAGLWNFVVSDDAGMPGVFRFNQDGSVVIASESYEGYNYPRTIVVEQQNTETHTVLDVFRVTFEGITIPLKERSVVHVSSLKGDNVFAGAWDSPVASISQAYEMVTAGGVLLLHPGNYGDLQLSEKPVTIKGVQGPLPRFLSIRGLPSVSYTLEGLELSGAGVYSEPAPAESNGSITIRKCLFSGISSAFDYHGCNIVALVQSMFKTGAQGFIKITNAEEVLLSANVFAGSGSQTIRVDSVKYLDCTHNTFNDLSSVFIDDETAGSGYGFTYVVLTDTHISTKQVTFPLAFAVSSQGVPQVAINLLDGSTSGYLSDWRVTGGNVITWKGLGLEQVLRVGDILRISYSLYGGSSTAGFSNLDSNNLTNISSMVLRSGLIALVHFNNFFGTTLSIPVPPTNIVLDPKYLSASTGNLALADGSPCIGRGCPIRGSDIFGMLQTAQYQQIQDVLGAHCDQVKGGPDIGAYSNLNLSQARVESGVTIAQGGYDQTGSGDSQSPVGSLGYAMTRQPASQISLDFGEAPGNVTSRHIYFDESIVSLQNVEITNEYAQSFLYSSKQKDPLLKRHDIAFIQPFDSALLTDSKVFVSPLGDDQSGDGSVKRPFRTISKGLSSDAQTIVVVAGNYPLFTGVTSKNLIFLPRIDERLVGGFISMDLSSAAWKVLHSEGVVFSYNDPFTVTHL